MLRKLRSAMVRPGREKLSGTVEVDETYIGGLEKAKQGRGGECKFIVAIVSIHLPRKPSQSWRQRDTGDKGMPIAAILGVSGGVSGVSGQS